MATMKRPRLKTVKPLADYRLKLTFVDDSRYTVDLADDIKKLPGLRPLKNPSAFSGVAVADGGWTVEWLAFDIQIGADTLWLNALEQSASNEAQREFLRWRGRNGLSLAAAGEAIGLTPRTISAFGTGARPVPKTVLLACKGWEAEHKRA